jgi:hypothetical protein
VNVTLPEKCLRVVIICLSVDGEMKVHKLTAVVLPCSRVFCGCRVKSLSVDIQCNCRSLRMHFLYKIKASNKLKEASGYGKNIMETLWFVYTEYRQLFVL